MSDTHLYILTGASRGMGLAMARQLLAPGVIDTDMQVQLRGADAAALPDRASFEQLKSGCQLDSPEAAAREVLAFLQRPDFGSEPVTDIRG